MVHDNDKGLYGSCLAKGLYGSYHAKGLRCSYHAKGLFLFISCQGTV